MSRPDYGPLARLLHRVALGPHFVGQASFDIEEMRTRSNALPDVNNPVFIAGLARSGSTILLNALYQTGVFRSLTYRDMPFVLMTGTWKRLAAGSQVQREARERAHGDRLLVDYNSPEAFEEVFWRVFCGEKYIFDDHVSPHKVPRSVRKNFDQFVRHVINSRDQVQQSRYLSKNNNNVLRLPVLKQVFPGAIIIIPFRDPLQQALSLLKQHQLFTTMHGSDRFSMRYMNWLGHYEFGLGHKHYRYTDSDNPFKATDINYWLQSWLDTYNFALHSAPADALFVGYEQLCEAPLPAFTELFPKLKLDSDPAAAAAFYDKAEGHNCNTHATELLDACQQTQAKLIARHSSL